MSAKAQEPTTTELEVFRECIAPKNGQSVDQHQRTCDFCRNRLQAKLTGHAQPLRF